MTLVPSANLDTFWELGFWSFQTNQDLETVRIVWFHKWSMVRGQMAANLICNVQVFRGSCVSVYCGPGSNSCGGGCQRGYVTGYSNWLFMKLWLVARIEPSTKLNSKAGPSVLVYYSEMLSNSEVFSCWSDSGVWHYRVVVETGCLFSTCNDEQGNRVLNFLKS